MQGKEVLKPVISAGDIAARVAALAREVEAWRRNEPLVAVCVLKGAFLFFADLVRHLSHPLYLDFVRAASYGRQTHSSGEVQIRQGLELDISDKRVLLVEDIVDTGLSMRVIYEELLRRNPAHLAVCTMLSKQERRQFDVHIDFVGFESPKGFLVGYGLDYAERYRELPDIQELSFE